MLLDTTVPRILGSFFYRPPTDPINKDVLPYFTELTTCFSWHDVNKAQELTTALSQFESDNLSYDFSILFEGQGSMPAPPWGSVYQDKENGLLGTSTLNYREFLRRQHIELALNNREPEDQFGLMLFAGVFILEQGHRPALREFLENHLLPWAPRYLTRVKEATLENGFYPLLAQLAEEYLNSLKQELVLNIKKVPLFF